MKKNIEKHLVELKQKKAKKNQNIVLYTHNLKLKKKSHPVWKALGAFNPIIDSRSHRKAPHKKEIIKPM